MVGHPSGRGRESGCVTPLLLGNPTLGPSSAWTLVSEPPAPRAEAACSSGLGAGDSAAGQRVCDGPSPVHSRLPDKWGCSQLGSRALSPGRPCPRPSSGSLRGTTGPVFSGLLGGSSQRQVRSMTNRSCWGQQAVMLWVAAWGALGGRCEPAVPATLSWGCLCLPFISHTICVSWGLGVENRECHSPSTQKGDLSEGYRAVPRLRGTADPGSEGPGSRAPRPGPAANHDLFTLCPLAGSEGQSHPDSRLSPDGAEILVLKGVARLGLTSPSLQVRGGGADRSA